MNIWKCIGLMAVGLVLAGPIGLIAGGILAIVIAMHDGGPPPPPRSA